MKNLTLRGIEPELKTKLRALASRESSSLNATILDVLRRALGVGRGKTVHTDLDQLAGGWTEEDLSGFLQRTRPFSGRANRQQLHLHSYR